jgi:hypothetical protein
MKPVDIASGLQSVLNILGASGFDYMIVGSVAGSIYGEPRLTRDLGLVVDIPVLAAVKFPALFRQMISTSHLKKYYLKKSRAKARSICCTIRVD